MSEKRGFTGKLDYDFPTEAVLEVCIKDNWYRTTSGEFRSFDGKRRITRVIKQPGRHVSYDDVEFETFDYDGPVYEFRTNNIVPYRETNKIIQSQKND